MSNDVSNKFNTNARLFNKDQVNKILQELDIKPDKKKPDKGRSVQQIEAGAPVRQTQGDVSDILRQNFIQDDN